MNIIFINVFCLLFVISAVTPNPTNQEQKRVITADYHTQVTQDDELLEDISPAKYQVTENVIDVPDDRPRPGPLTFNYTSKRPLNFASTPNAVNENTGKNDTEEHDLKRNKLSILHINADFDEHNADNQNNNNHSIFKGIKRYFHGIKKEIINCVHSLFHKKDNIEN